MSMILNCSSYPKKSAANSSMPAIKILLLGIVYCVAGQPTPPPVTEDQGSNNDSERDYSREAMIIGIVIACIVLAVLTATIAWFFLYADRSAEGRNYDTFDDTVENVKTFDEAEENSASDANGWVEKRGSPIRRTSSMKSTRSTYSRDSWVSEAAEVHDDIMTRLGLSVFDSSDEDDDVPSKKSSSSRKKSKRGSHRRTHKKSDSNSVKRFNRSEATLNSTAHDDDDDDIVITKQTVATPTSEVSASNRDLITVSRSSTQSRSVPMNNIGSTADATPFDQAVPHDLSSQIGLSSSGGRNRRYVNDSITVDKIGHV